MLSRLRVAVPLGTPGTPLGTPGIRDDRLLGKIGMNKCEMMRILGNDL